MMKSKIFFIMLCNALLLCGCTENNTSITVSSENKVYETVSKEETFSSVIEKTTSPTSTTTIPNKIEEDPFFDHRQYRYDVECDFVQFISDETEIYAEDGTLLGPITVEYPQVITDDEKVNNKINSTYKEYMDYVMLCNTPFFNLEHIYENYEEWGAKYHLIDGVTSDLTYIDDKYISFRDYHMFMGTSAAHPAHAYTAHTFSLKTGDLLTIEDLFNEDFIHFAEKYIVNDLNEIDYRYHYREYNLFLLPVRDNVDEKLKNNEWYLTPDGFTIIFAHSELTAYALGTFSSTIPWKLISEYMKDPGNL